MPLGMDRLTSLSELTYFVVGRKEQSDDDELKALKGLTKIKGRIEIQISKNYRIVVGLNDTGRGGYLKSMKHLREVDIDFLSHKGGCVNPEVVLETLEPPSNIKRLLIGYYHGTTINWAIFPSHLVDIRLECCGNLQEMPMLSKLPHLKSLHLEELNKLEYIESTSSNSSSDTEAETPELPTFFPSLEKLILWGLKKFKGLGNRRSSSFPRLSELEIKKCPDLTSFPPCPSLEKLDLFQSNETLKIIVKTTRGKEKEEDNDAGAGNSQDDDNVKLRKVKIDNLGYLKLLTLYCLTHLEIIVEEEIESDSEEEEEIELEVVEAFQKSASSLQNLNIRGMNKLKRLTGRTGLEHFSALDELTLYKVDDCDVSFPQNLSSLRIENSPKMTSLPMEIQYLTSLQTLKLIRCDKLNSLPEWISTLSSLQYLDICLCSALKSLPEAMKNLTSLQILHTYGCPDLVKRCKKPDGEDYPKIQHIPKIGLTLLS
ncbi:hypothetical protein SOVF_136970 [Spinacia oleracea]|nr:hypothetical protein SOVF_136970 [Spinacia oleracea]